MKRIICTILLFSFTTGLFAQKWLKDIGKVLNTVEKVVDKFPDNKNKQSEQRNRASAPMTFTYEDVEVSTTLPNFTIIIEDVKRVGSAKGAVYLTLINTSNNPVRIYDWQNISELVDSKGNSYADYGKWELQIGDCTIRRYGTDGDYMFQSNQKVNAVFYITDLNGTATTESDKVGRFVKTTVKVPSVIIDKLVLNPSIVYQEENVRRNYTIEINNLKIPAYVHINRTGVETDTPVQVKENTRTPANTVQDTSSCDKCEDPKKDTEKKNGEKADTQKEPEKDSSQSPTSIIGSLPSSSPNDTKNKDDDANKKDNLKNLDSENTKDKSNSEGPTKGSVESLGDTIGCIPIGPILSEEQRKVLIQDVLNRQVEHVALRRDVHYTNEPTGDWRAQYRFTALNLSSAEYNNFDGIVFEYIDGNSQFKTNKEREIATQYSSYPRKGTRCGIITGIASEFRKDMERKTHMGIPAYIFNANKLTLLKIEETDERTVNGKKMFVFIVSVTDAPTPFGIAYNEAIRKANGGTKKSYESKQLLCGLGFEYNSQTEQWELVIATKYDSKTGKWEKWVTV